MSSSVTDVRPPLAQRIAVSNDALVVDLTDGRTITVPLSWYPRLQYGTPAQRAKWRLIGRGVGIHWPELDEDISVEGLLAGQPSNESPTSLQRWLRARGLLANNALQRPAGTRKKVRRVASGSARRR